MFTLNKYHYSDVMMSAMASQIISLTIFAQPFIHAQIKEDIEAPGPWGLCAGNPPVTGEFSAQRANNVENVSIWWRYHDS